MSERKGWVDNVPFPVFSSRPDSKNFLSIAPIRDGENGFFDHLIHVDATYKRSHPITHGSQDVLQIHVWDEDSKFVLVQFQF